MSPSDWTLLATLAFLVGFFAAAELWHRRHGIAGTLVELEPEEVPLAGLLARRARVDLPDGRRVTATLSGCVLCQGAFRPGDAVRVSRAGDGFVLGIPSGRRSPACARSDVEGARRAVPGSSCVGTVTEQAGTARRAPTAPERIIHRAARG